ncbi:MAG: lipoate--protein ligase [Candidatus Izemoplasmatales bacterium]|jgi:lipoyltransferase/lipoate-protein ligase|nr:lipoate--protein ligase [Candidatus Izemoplasmatales bacterium]
MRYVSYPFSEIKRLSFYLATEEFLALHYPPEDYFFMWQVQPTVIFGRNQLIENEVNLDYVRANGIEYYRRKSGGGCVYADFSNIMFSYITASFHKDFVFSSYLSRIVDMLNSLGLHAEASGRNDILVDGLKVSGNAFYRVNDRSIVHGTMLFDTDLEIMVRAITPDNEKLVSKGIASVRNRVMNLKGHIQMNMEQFKEYVRSHLTESAIVLTDSDIQAIETIEKTYLDPDFIYGKNPHYTILRKKHVSAGLLEVSLVLKNNIVKQISLLGDYFVIADPDIFLKKLIQVPFTKADFTHALVGLDLSEYVYNLTLNDFLEIIF